MYFTNLFYEEKSIWISEWMIGHFHSRNSLPLMLEKRSFDGKSQKLKQKLFKFLQLYFYAMESLMPSWLRMLICISPKQTHTNKALLTQRKLSLRECVCVCAECVCVCGGEIPFVQTTTIKTSWGLRMSKLFCSLIHKFLIKLPSHFSFYFPFFILFFFFAQTEILSFNEADFYVRLGV